MTTPNDGPDQPEQPASPAPPETFAADQHGHPAAPTSGGPFGYPPPPPAPGPDPYGYQGLPTAPGPDPYGYQGPPTQSQTSGGPFGYPPPPAPGTDRYGDPQQPYGPDVYLANPYSQAPPARPASHTKKIIAGAAVLAVLAGGAVAAYAYTVLASGGTQPEKVLPATAVAFAKLDLDPAAGQKIAAYRLSAKFPKLSKGASDIDGVKSAALSDFFDGQTDLDYNTDIKPWLGDRIAVAAVPDSSASGGVDPVLAVAYTDETKMKAAFTKAQPGQDFGYVTLDGYTLISDSQSHAESVLAAVRRGTLADSAHFRADLKSLHGDQIAVGWADVEATTAALKAAAGSSSQLSDFGQLDKLTVKGRIVLGAHANSDYLEISAISHSTPTSGAPQAASKPVTGKLLNLAADTSMAIEVNGLGQALSSTWTSMSAALGAQEQFQELIDETGLKLPADFEALFGTDTTVSVRLPHGPNGDPEIAAQITTGGADRALQLLDSLGVPFGLPSDSLHPRRTSDGYLVSNSSDYDPRVPSGAATLGSDPAFRKAVPNSVGAGLIGYVNVGRILDSDPDTSAKDKADWKHVGAFGLSVVTTPDGGRMTLRMTTR